jgi:hypothetical protein
MPSGHPTTALAETLDLKPGMRVFIADMPSAVREAAQIDRIGLELLAAPSAGIEAACLFVNDRERLECQLHALCQLIARGGFIWVAWRSGDGDVDKGEIHDIAAALDLSEARACTIDDHWCATKLMRRQP